MLEKIARDILYSMELRKEKIRKNEK